MAFTRAGFSKVIDPLKQTLSALHLRPVKSIKFTFDPYHPNVRSMRESLFYIKQTKILTTNFNCSTKVDIKCNRCEPEIKVAFIDDHNLIFKTSNLTTLEILEKLTNVCIEKDPKKDEPVLLLTKTKKKKK